MISLSDGLCTGVVSCRVVSCCVVSCRCRGTRQHAHPVILLQIDGAVGRASPEASDPPNLVRTNPIAAEVFKFWSPCVATATAASTHRNEATYAARHTLPGWRWGVGSIHFSPPVDNLSATAAVQQLFDRVLPFSDSYVVVFTGPNLASFQCIYADMCRSRCGTLIPRSRLLWEECCLSVLCASSYSSS